MNTANWCTVPSEMYPDLTGKALAASVYQLDACLQVDISNKPGSHFLTGFAFNARRLRLLPEM